MHFLWRNIAVDFFLFLSIIYFKGYTIPEVDNLHYTLKRKLTESLTKMYLLKTRVCFHKKCNVQSTLPVLSRCMYTIILLYMRARVCMCVCVLTYSLFYICYLYSCKHLDKLHVKKIIVLLIQR